MNRKNFRANTKSFSRSLLLRISILALGLPLNLKAQDSKLMQDSIVPVTAEELALPAAATEDLLQELTLTIGMKMRNLAELDARLRKGEIISPAEMTEKYYPLEADYQHVRTWLINSGLSEIPLPGPRLSVTVTGPAWRIASLFRVQFVKEQLQGSTSLAAVNAPSVPTDVAALVLGVDGLQPQYHAHPSNSTDINPIPAAMSGSKPAAGNVAYDPNQIYTAYNGNNLPNRGSNQMIAIIGSIAPSPTDISNYWNMYGIPQSSDRYQTKAVQGAAQPAEADSIEWTLDVEWASSIAPSSVVRFYPCLSLSNANLVAAYAQVVNDLPSSPTLHQVSLSFGLGEAASSSAYAQQVSNYMMSMASGGVTVFVASGDGGSNPNFNGAGLYRQSAARTVEIPADSPYVTAVGGTTLRVDANGISTGETAWSVSGDGVTGEPALEVVRVLISQNPVGRRGRVFPPATTGMSLTWRWTLTLKRVVMCSGTV